MNFLRKTSMMIILRSVIPYAIRVSTAWMASSTWKSTFSSWKANASSSVHHRLIDPQIIVFPSLKTLISRQLPGFAIFMSCDVHWTSSTGDDFSKILHKIRCSLTLQNNTLPCMDFYEISELDRKSPYIETYWKWRQFTMTMEVLTFLSVNFWLCFARFWLCLANYQPPIFQCTSASVNIRFRFGNCMVVRSAILLQKGGD